MKHKMATCEYCTPNKVIYDGIRVTVHDEGYDGIWITEQGDTEGKGDNILFTEKDIKFSSKTGRATESEPFFYRLTLVEDFDA